MNDIEKISKEIPLSYNYAEDGRYVWPERWAKISELLSKHEKPFRVVQHKNFINLYSKIEDAKEDEYYIRNLADVECLCVNGEWVKVA